MKAGKTNKLSDRTITYGSGKDRTTVSVGDVMKIYSVGDKQTINGTVEGFYVVKNNVVAAKATGEIKKGGKTIRRTLWKFLGRR